ncbi:competence protein CoiA family protein [Streptomyces odontomachi]|uniref:competence protein CoiA family protein n=1 Tax=Streptomyces odontomachi TaxID=2944940 RepID=UPI00403E6168
MAADEPPGDVLGAHLPVTHRPTPAESAQHKATKERVVETAARHGLDSEAEVPLANRRSVTDAVVTGPNGQRIGWEIQYHHISPSSVHRRSVNAVEHGITPLWVAKDRTASLIDRAPWARVDDMPWRDIADGKEMVIRSGTDTSKSGSVYRAANTTVSAVRALAIVARFTRTGSCPRCASRSGIRSTSRTWFCGAPRGRASRSTCQAVGTAALAGTCGSPLTTARCGRNSWARRPLCRQSRPKTRTTRSPLPSRRSTASVGQEKRAGS